jgi:hypothetical protein
LGTKPQIEAGKMQLQAAETQGQQQIDRAKVEIAAFQAGAQAGTA